jgi:acetylornithine deacetylase/succinyl-diaminopimelate desuccinylase-like protein
MTIDGWLEARADEMAELLCDLVAVDTTNPPGRGLGRCGRLLRDHMERLGLAPELIELEPRGQLEEPCILRGGAGDGGRIVYFHGHFDVVPAQDPAQFSPQRRDGRIAGRGTADMKGGLVSLLYGAVAARELGLLGDARVVLHLVCDEETGSVAGSGHLRAAGLIDPGAAAMLTPEPTGGVVWHANRGAITIRVEVAGREAHVGQAELGDNAFEKMIRVAAPLAELAEELRRERGSTLVVGGAAGAGAGFNVVPGSAWFSLDRRFNPDEDLDEEVRRLTDAIERAAADAGAEVAIDVLQRAPSARTDASHPAAQALAGCIAEVEGAPARFELCPGVLETRWYAQLGIPAFGYGAGRLDVSHGPEEFIDEAAMRRCAAVYARFAAAAIRPAAAPGRSPSSSSPAGRR